MTAELRIPVAAEALAKLGRFKEATAQIKREMREIDRATTRALKRGEALDSQQARRREQLVSLQSTIDTSMATEKRLAGTQKTLKEQTERTRAAATAVNTILGSGAIKKIIRGEQIDFRELGFAALTFGEPAKAVAERLAQTGGRFGKAAGGVAKFLGATAPYLPLVGAAAQDIVQAFDDIKNEDQARERFQAAQNSGKIGANEGAFFWKLASDPNLLRDGAFQKPLEQWTKAREAASIVGGFGKLKRTDLDVIFKKLDDEAPPGSKKRFFWLEGKMNRAIDEAYEERIDRFIENRQLKLGRELTQEERAIIVRGELIELMKDPEVVDAIIEANEKKKIEEPLEKVKTVSEIFREREEQTMFAIQDQRNRAGSIPAVIPFR